MNLVLSYLWSPALGRALSLLQGEAAPSGESTGEGGAPGTDAGEGGGIGDFFGGSFVPIVLIVLIFYVLMIGPEKRQRKKHQAMLAALGKGDRVMTSSGIYGRVAQVKDDVVTLSVADNVRMQFALSSIQRKVEEEKTESKAS
jgi:preprotein translocase subunit YajC